MRRFIPLAIVIVIAITVAVVYIPELLKVRQFKATCNAMLSDAEMGNWTQLPGYVRVRDAQAMAQLTQLVSRELGSGVGTLKLTSYDKPDSNTIWALVTLQYDEHGTNLIYQGKLRWIYQDGSWVWDLMASYYAPYGGFTDPEWSEFSELIVMAEGY